MNKQQLLDEIERLKAQVEQLQEPKTGRVLSLGGFEDGFTVEGSGRVLEVNKKHVLLYDYFETGNLFHDKESAEKHVKYLELWQRARQFIADDWIGEEVDWSDREQIKYTIRIALDVVVHERVSCSFDPLHFKSMQSRLEFRSQFSDDDIKLMLMGV